jgi:predicted type IV restriction endonuclease
MPDFEDRLATFRSRVKNIRERAAFLNEANTKARVIQPLLEILGWNIREDNEVILEYPVRMGSGTGNVDYALQLNDVPVVFVEAKGMDTRITDNMMHQAISYGKVEDVPWCIITNGWEWIILNSKWGKTPDQCRFATFSMDELTEKRNLLNLLEKQNVEQGKLDDEGRRIRKLSSTFTRVKANWKRISDDIAKVLRKYCPEMDNRLASDIVKDLEERLNFLEINQRFQAPERHPTPNEEFFDIIVRRIHTPKTYALIWFPRRFRTILPGYKEDFTLETDIGSFVTRVTSASKGTRKGDPKAGKYIRGGLRSFYDAHPELEDGSVFRIEVLKPKKEYRLQILKTSH